MKKKMFLVPAAALFIAVGAFAQGASVDSGDKALDKFLSGLASDYTAGKLSKDELSNELNFSFGLSYKDFNLLASKGFNAGEVYLVSMMSKQSKKSIKELIKKRKPGQGWGELAHQLGIHPSELNKMRVAAKKDWKKNQKTAKKEHKASNKK